MDHQRWIQTKTAKPPKPEHVTPLLREQRRQFYAQSHRLDWTAIAEMQYGAYRCLKEHGAV